MYLLWNEYLTELLTNERKKERKKELYYRMLNVHSKTEEEMDEIMRTETFTNFIGSELHREQVDTISAETAYLSDIVCQSRNRINCDTCVKD